MNYITGGPGRWKFEPVAYTVSDEAMKSTFTVRYTNGQGVSETREVTLGRDCELIAGLDAGVDSLGTLNLIVGAGVSDAKAEGVWLTQYNIINLCMHLHEKGNQGFVDDRYGGSFFLPELYFYERDAFTYYGGGDVYKFFVVFDGRIVSDCEWFEDSKPGKEGKTDSFDPTMLTGPIEESRSLHDREMDQARYKYWYRKFYKSTFNGQLMVLRPDNPELYRYPEGRQPSTRELLNEVKSAKQVLVWIGIALTLLVLARFVHF